MIHIHLLLEITFFGSSFLPVKLTSIHIWTSAKQDPKMQPFPARSVEVDTNWANTPDLHGKKKTLTPLTAHFHHDISLIKIRERDPQIRPPLCFCGKLRSMFWEVSVVFGVPQPHHPIYRENLGEKKHVGSPFRGPFRGPPRNLIPSCNGGSGLGWSPMHRPELMRHSRKNQAINKQPQPGDFLQIVTDGSF